MIYSLDKRLEVAKLAGCSSGDVLSYTGFEDYEDKSSWRFDPANVRRNLCWPFTGRSLLHLAGPTQTLSGTFKPSLTRAAVYRASCWLRVNNNQSRGPPPDGCFTVSVRSDTNPNNDNRRVQASVKCTRRDWIYMEADVESSSGCIIDVAIRCAGDWTDVHVDSVYFGPAVSRASFYVYQPETRQMSARSENGGLMFKRIVYSHALEPLAVLDDQIESVAYGPTVKEILLTNNSYLKRFADSSLKFYY